MGEWISGLIHGYTVSFIMLSYGAPRNVSRLGTVIHSHRTIGYETDVKQSSGRQSVISADLGPVVSAADEPQAIEKWPDER